jgi:hypothetical protein
MSIPQSVYDDVVHYGLFGASCAQLRKRLGLPAKDTPDNDNLHDEMGIEALMALTQVEGESVALLRANPFMTQREALAIISQRAGVVGDKLRADCLVKGVDPVTGLPASRNGVSQ